MSCETVYVSNLPEDVHFSELRECFEKFGRIHDIDIKRRSGITYAFVRYSSPSEATRCVREGKIQLGRTRCIVNYSRRDGLDKREKSFSYGSHRKTKYCAVISDLPRGTSWQDLKDFCRPEADVILSIIVSPSIGKVYFESKKDLNMAVERLDRKRLRSHQNETGAVRLRIASPSVSRSLSRSRSYSPERRGYNRYRSRSKSLSYSPSRSYSDSYSDSDDRDSFKRDDHLSTSRPRSRENYHSESRSRSRD